MGSVPSARSSKIEARAISELTYDDRFVRSLPADPLRGRGVRVVRQACFSHVDPTPVTAPRLLALIPEVAALLDLAPVESTELVEVLAGNRLVPGMSPYAACYGGHQFGRWAGQLGDGRAITLGEVLSSRGERWEIQLKGAGPTPYSRHADGRAVLRSSLRELVASEAMHHLGVPTTRALALVETGEGVVRDLLYDGNPRTEPGAIVCRVAPSFLRFGNFQLPASRGELGALGHLVAFTITSLHPELGAPSPSTVVALFDLICQRTARVVVEWSRVGFVHGVLNTDNMSILGLTIDYGPFGWLDDYDPNWTPNITDAQGRRYRFENQARVALFNLAQLAEALLPLVGEPEPIEAALARYVDEVALSERRMGLEKLGLEPRGPAVDDRLLEEVRGLLTSVETDMTLFYRGLAEVSAEVTPFDPTRAFSAIERAHYSPQTLPGQVRDRTLAFLAGYVARVREDGTPDTVRRARMNLKNPLYVPRNYLLQRAIDGAEAGSTTELANLLDVLRRPYTEQLGREAFAQKRPEWARNRPGCSMLSCSS